MVTIRVVQASQDQARALSRIDSTFMVNSQLALCLEHGRLSYTVAPTAATIKSYARTAVTQGAAAPTVTFVAFADERHIGRIDLSKHWSGFAFIDDLVVDRTMRRAGVATALLQQATQWVQAQALPGLMAETQNNNVAACRLYERCGFRLSGFDADLYRAHDRLANEVALFWYWHSKARGTPSA